MVTGPLLKLGVRQWEQYYDDNDDGNDDLGLKIGGAYYIVHAWAFNWFNCLTIVA